MADGILGHLHQHLVTRLQGVFYLAGAPVQLGLAPVDFTGVKHAVSALSDVHEGRLHGRQHVLNAAQVNIANERGLGLGGHEVLDQQVIFQHTHLGDDAGAVLALLIAHHHGALHGFTAGKELRLGDDVLAGAALFAQLGTTALLSLDARGATDGLRLFNVLGLVCLLFTLRTRAASAGCAAAPTAAALRLSGTAARAGAGVLAAFVGGGRSVLIVIACGVVGGEVLLRCVNCRCECRCLVLLRGHEDGRKVIVPGVFLGFGARDDVRGVVVILEILAGLGQHLVQLRRINRSGIERASRCFVRLIRGFCRFRVCRFSVLGVLSGCASFGCGLGQRCLYLVFDLGDLIVYVLAYAVAQVFFVFRGLLPFP